MGEDQGTRYKFQWGQQAEANFDAFSKMAGDVERLLPGNWKTVKDMCTAIATAKAEVSEFGADLSPEGHSAFLRFI